MTTPDQIKAIEADFKLFWGEAPKGTLKCQKGEDTFNFFRHSIAQLLTAEIEVLEGEKRTMEPEATWDDIDIGNFVGHNDALDQQINRYREIINSLE